MINDLIKKLRKTADVLEDLLDYSPLQNKEAAEAIKASIHKELTMKDLKKMPKKKVLAILNNGFHSSTSSKESKETNPNKKSFSYKGKHWTQKPENKAKLKKVVKKMIASRKIIV